VLPVFVSVSSMSPSADADGRKYAKPRTAEQLHSDPEEKGGRH
jgi:hypothetical protein